MDDGLDELPYLCLCLVSYILFTVDLKFSKGGLWLIDNLRKILGLFGFFFFFFYYSSLLTQFSSLIT